MFDITRTATLIKRGREEAGLTQDQLAEMLYVTKQAVSNWERGKNLPDEGLRDQIEQVLQIKLHKEKMSTFASKPFLTEVPEIKPLESIGEINELLGVVETIIASIKLKEYESVVKKLLYLTLVTLLGYEIYYEKHCCKYYSGEHDDELDWASTACNLRDLKKNYDLWPMGRSWREFRAESFIGKKFEFMASRIGGELFEDFDDDGYCDGFVQQIGRCGESCGYDMINLLPESNTDILIINKAAVLDVAEMLESTISDEE